MQPIINQFDYVVFHFDGNVNDPDDIAAVPVAALLAKAAGIEGKVTFLTGNNLAEKTNSGQNARLKESSEFAESLGIEVLNYQDNVAGTTGYLVDILNNSQYENVLLIDGGPMEASYRALENVSNARLDNITQVSHSSWNENRSVINKPGVTEARTWDDIADDFPRVNQVEIRDQNNGSNNDKGFNNKNWSFLDSADDPVLQAARDAMTLARSGGNRKDNDPSDAGMLFWAITGDDSGTPQDVEDYFDAVGFPGAEAPSVPAPPSAPAPGGELDGIPDGYEIRLIDTTSNSVIETIENGEEIDGARVAGRKLSLEVTTDDDRVESFRLDLNGIHEQVENLKPYALFGDTGNSFREGTTLDAGDYEFDVEAFSADKASGTRLADFEVDFSITGSGSGSGSGSGTPPQAPSGDVPPGFEVSLVDTTTDEILEELSFGEEVDLALVEGRKIGLSVTTDNDAVESMRLSLEGGRTAVENITPYALFGDIRGDYRPGTEFDEGTYELEIEAFSADRARGSELEAFDFEFSIVA